MMDARLLARAAVTFAFLVLSLGFVTWRQSRAFEANLTLDEVRRQVSVAEAEQVELERDIQVLRGRAHIVPAAEALGLFTPAAEDQFIIARVGDDQ